MRHFLTIARYNSWQDFATNDKTSVTDTLKPDGGWLGVNRSTYHNNTMSRVRQRRESLVSGLGFCACRNGFC